MVVEKGWRGVLTLGHQDVPTVSSQIGGYTPTPTLKVRRGGVRLRRFGDIPPPPLGFRLTTLYGSHRTEGEVPSLFEFSRRGSLVPFSLFFRHTPIRRRVDGWWTGREEKSLGDVVTSLSGFSLE